MASSTLIAGIDLSGPSNIRDSVMVLFQKEGEALSLLDVVTEASDQDILDAMTPFLNSTSQIYIGIDAPLSYNPGGGDRPGDKSLRVFAAKHGLLHASVMPPTLNKMVYLTLRGISIARNLQSLPLPNLEIIEVHPGAAMVSRGAPVDAVRSMKSSPNARNQLVEWLADQNLSVVTSHLPDPLTDHFIAACAAALATWSFASGCPLWVHSRQPPFHPFHYAC